MNREVLKAWAEKLVLPATGPVGATAEQLIELQLADEPDWYFPSTVENIKANLGWLEAFRNYLKNQGLSPGDVGTGDWSQVVPITTGKVGVDAPSRRLFLATLRFLTESATEGLAMARAAVQCVLEDLGASRDRDAFIFLNYKKSPTTGIFRTPIMC